MATETLEPPHADVNEDLNAYLDGQLDAARRAAVEAHAAACSVCAEDLAELRSTRQVLRAQSMLRAPRTFVVPAAPPPANRWQGLLAWGWRLGSVATAACVVVAALSAGTGPTAYPTDGQGASASLAKSAPERPLEVRTASPARDAAQSRVAAPAAPPAASGGTASIGLSSGASADRAGSVEGARLQAAQATQAPAPAGPERTTNESGRVPRSVPWGVAGLVLASASAYAFIVERRLRAA